MPPRRASSSWRVEIRSPTARGRCVFGLRIDQGRSGARGDFPFYPVVINRFDQVLICISIRVGRDHVGRDSKYVSYLVDVDARGRSAEIFYCFNRKGSLTTAAFLRPAPLISNNTQPAFHGQFCSGARVASRSRRNGGCEQYRLIVCLDGGGRKCCRRKKAGEQSSGNCMGHC